MKYEERIQDLFETPAEYCLAHCISADFVMGKGIVVEFNKRFGIKKLLKQICPNYMAEWVSEGLTFDFIPTGRAFNLITKTKYSDKPTYDTLRGALEAMRDHCIRYNKKKIAMPVIGCGLDKLEWDKVSAIIREVFENTDIEILVCLRA